MELKKLAALFYADNKSVKQALDFDEVAGTWTEEKVRGHGIVQISINGLVFAIPVRSNIKHNASLILKRDLSPSAIKGMGLDYSKALLIRNPAHVSDEIFLLRDKPSARNLEGKELHVTKQFSKYVERYILAVRESKHMTLNSSEYRFTTLVNYHAELGLV